MSQTVEGYVGDSLDNAKLSPLHWRVISLITAGLFFDLFDIAIFGSLVPDMLHSKFATPTNIAFVASVTFLGLLIGSVGQGELTDRFGRKTVYQANLLIYGLGTIASGFAPDYLTLAAARFVAGVGLGAEVPLCFSYAAEFSPKQIRGRIMALVNLIGGTSPWPLALLFALAFRDIIGWRGIFVIIGICALIVFVFRITLPELPRWLATHGQGKLALEILKRLGIANVPPIEQLTVDASSNTHSDPIAVVFGQYRRRVIALMIAFCAHFMTTFLLATWLPTLMAGQGFSITKALTFTMVTTLAFPCSSIFLMLTVDYLGRITTAVTAFVVAAIMAVAFVESSSDVMVLVTGFCMTLAMQVAGNALLYLAAEIFPTNARASGAGLGLGAGRVGAMIASYSILAVQAFGVQVVFFVIAALLCIAGLSTLMIGQETKRLGLDAIAPPTA